jgi:hypothetical protein
VSKQLITTWFYQQSSDEGGTYAQVRGSSSTERFRDTYRKCIATFFASARRANPQAELVLVLNTPWQAAASATAARVGELLNELGVQTLTADYSFKPPTTWRDSWRNQFFVYDVLRVLISRCGPTDQIIICDSDMVWSSLEGADRIRATLERDQSLTYNLALSLDEDINGLSRRQLGGVFSRLSGEDVVAPAYLGGELFGATGAEAVRALALAEEVWSLTLEDHRCHRPNLWEEAHLLSYLSHQLDWPIGNANTLVKRIWTQPFKYRNTRPMDLRLPLWHVPAEKRYGLRRMYDSLPPAGDLTNLSDDAFVRRYGPMLGVGGNPAMKTLLDSMQAAVGRLQERYSTARSSFRDAIISIEE